MEFRTIALKDIVDADRGISYGIVQPGVNTIDGVPVIRVNNLGENAILMNDVLHVDAEVSDRYKRTILQGGELLLSLVGTVGRCVIAPQVVKGWNVARAIGVIPLKANINSKWVKYCIQSSTGQEYIKNRLNTTVQATFNLRDLAEFPIPYPAKEIQDSIAATLSSLDDKIELNNRIIANLEAQALAIFKSWFVDFEPFQEGEFEESELGLIPKGWRVGRLGDAAEIQNRTFKPNSDSMIIEHYSIPAYDERRYPIFEEASFIKSNKFYINTDCFMISKLNPETKRIWRPLCLTSHAVCSTEFIVYKAKNSKQMLFYYSLIDGIEFFNFLTSHVTGSTGSRQRATPKDTLEFRYALPPNELVDEFVEVVTPVYKEIDTLSIEIVKLKSTRDTLLPKLMSGEIEVPVEG